MAMMTVCVLLLALCCLPLTSALGDTNSIASIKAPSEVTAATSFQAFFSGYFVSDTFDGAYAKYLRVYLAAEKEDVAPQFYNPDCKASCFCHSIDYTHVQQAISSRSRHFATHLSPSLHFPAMELI